MQYCRIASDYNRANGHKEFRYLFIPHDEVILYYNHNYPKFFRFQKVQKPGVSLYLPEYEIKVCFTEEGFEIARFIYNKYKKISRFE